MKTFGAIKFADKSGSLSVSFDFVNLILLIWLTHLTVIIGLSSSSVSFTDYSIFTFPHSFSSSVFMFQKRVIFDLLAFGVVLPYVLSSYTIFHCHIETGVEGALLNLT